VVGNEVVVGVSRGSGCTLGPSGRETVVVAATVGAKVGDSSVGVWLTAGVSDSIGIGEVDPSGVRLPGSTGTPTVGNMVPSGVIWSGRASSVGSTLFSLLLSAFSSSAEALSETRRASATAPAGSGALLPGSSPESFPSSRSLPLLPDSSSASPVITQPEAPSTQQS